MNQIKACEPECSISKALESYSTVLPEEETTQIITADKRSQLDGCIYIDVHFNP